LAGTLPADLLAVTDCRRSGFGCDCVDAPDFFFDYGSGSGVDCDPYSALVPIETFASLVIGPEENVSEIGYSFLNQSVNAVAVSWNVADSSACSPSACAGAAAVQQAATQTAASG